MNKQSRSYLKHMSLRLMALALTFTTLAGVWQSEAASVKRSWQEEVMYFMMTDRFHDGDQDNNIPENCSPDFYDAQQENIDLYHGGDFRGIELAIKNGYFQDLGVTALWITPPVRNSWYSLHDKDGPKTGYHGYWAQDFLDIDPHLTSKSSLSGKYYPEGKEGRLEHYKDMIELAHQNGIKIVQDIVCNHIGPLFYYDIDKSEQHEGKASEWLPPYSTDGSYLSHARWAKEKSWGVDGLSGPMGQDRLFGNTLTTTGVLRNFDIYWGKGFNRDSLGKNNGEEMFCDFFSLRAINTSPNTLHFDRLVDEFVEIYRFYIEDIGVDGLRIDTVKHVHKEFWDAFCTKLRARLGAKADKVFFFGEVYANTYDDLTYYSVTDDKKEKSIGSLLNFKFTWAVRDVLRQKTQGSAEALKGFVESMYSKIPDFDALTAKEIRQTQINFIDNHDGLNRFLVRDIPQENHDLALGLLALFEGIPCIYYGSELSMRDHVAHRKQNSETGRLTLFDRQGQRHFDHRKGSKTFAMLSKLIALRKQFPSLIYGQSQVLQIEGMDTKSCFALKRGEGAGATLILLNSSNEKKKVAMDQVLSSMSSSGIELIYDNGKVIEQPKARHNFLEPKSLRVYHQKR
ncbi:MAG: hypothetical protein HQL32_02750 [Planctomycetes bacterium]|nr:hypothetical protein [Planctomycetota bacterium]